MYEVNMGPGRWQGMWQTSLWLVSIFRMELEIEADTKLASVGGCDNRYPNLRKKRMYSQPTEREVNTSQIAVCQSRGKGGILVNFHKHTYTLVKYIQERKTLYAGKAEEEKYRQEEVVVVGKKKEEILLRQQDEQRHSCHIFTHSGYSLPCKI